jgi:hypothetical protein
MLRSVDLVKTDVSEEPSASIIRVTIIGELGTTLAVTSDARYEEILTTTYVVTSAADCGHALRVRDCNKCGYQSEPRLQ